MVMGVVVGVTHGLWHSEYDLKTQQCFSLLLLCTI